MLDPQNLSDFLIECKYLYYQSPQYLTFDDQQINSSYKNQIAQISKFLLYTNDYQSLEKDCQNNNKNSTCQFFVIYQKLVQNNQINQAIKHLQINHRSHNNRHILIYNIANLYEKVSENKRAIFWYETLLKQDGMKRQIYVYNYVNILIKENRIQQAFNLIKRYINVKNTKKTKLQQLFIKILNIRGNKIQINYFLEHYFNNRILSSITIYNIALLIKSIYPQKSEKLLENLLQRITNNSDDGYFDQQNQKMCLKIKINILYILQKKLSLVCKMDSAVCESTKSKYVKIYNQIEKKLEQSEFVLIPEVLRIRKTKIQHQFKQTVQNNKKNENYLTAIFNNTSSNNCLNPTNSLFIQSQQISTPPQTIHPETNTHNDFISQRKLNEHKLKFLMNKQKQLNKFFQNLKIFKQNNTLNIKINDPKAAIKSTKRQHKTNMNQMNPIYAKFQEQFAQKREKIRLEFQQEEIDEMIYELLGENCCKNNKKNSNFVRNQIRIDKVQAFVSKLYQQKNNQGNQFNIRLIQPKLSDASPNLQSHSTSKTNSKATSKIQSSNSLNKCSSKLITYLKGDKNQAINLFSKKYQRNTHKKSSINPVNEKHKYEHLLNEAQICQRANKLEAAHQIYEKMYKLFKETQQKETILLKIANNFEKLQFNQEAEKTYKKCAKIFNNFQAFYRLGCLQIKNGAIKQGIENLQKANCIQRNNLKIQIKLVHAYSILDQTVDRALCLANSILERNPNCLEALILTAKIFQKKGRIKDALDIGLIICSLKASPPFYHYVGLLYLQDSNINQAFKFFQLAIQCNSEYIPSLIELATILSENSPKQAVQLLKKTISLDDKNIVAYARLAKIYQSINQDYQSALEIYKKCLQIQQNYESYLKIGDCYQKMNNMMDSLVSYNKALSFKKTSELYEKIGCVLTTQKQQKKAIQSFVHSLNQLNNEQPSFYIQQQRKRLLFKIGTLSINSGDFQFAINHLLQAQEIDDNYQVSKMLGHAYFGQGQYLQALLYFKQASQLTEQDNLELLQNIAMCYDKQQQYMVSKEIYEKILQTDPKNVRCLNNLANILLILGKTNQAFYWFEFMLQQTPNNIDKRLRVSDIYATIGDWSKVQQHLLICAKQKQNDIRVLQRMVNLYKQKRDSKLTTKFEKKLAFFKQSKA